MRRLPIGAEPRPEGGVDFRVWAPRAARVEVVIEGGPVAALASEADGYFRGVVPGVGSGALYRYRLDGGQPGFPDPASRFQPRGPHGPSQVIDPAGFRWTDEAWPGLALRGQVIYELHVGTFTPAGTFEAASRELEALRTLGITAVELMPVADFAGRFGWGYDGVNLFAPTRLYGTPDELRRLVDRAHALGLGVILDVVYNHFGPDGNYLPDFSPDYTTDRYTTDWGAAINFDGEQSGPVREFFVANAAYWIEEFHIDGLRLDATQNIRDRSADHILAAIARRVRGAAGRRRRLLIAENEPQEVRFVRRPDQGGYGLDAVWNDDFHHATRVAVTGRNEGYYIDYRGTPQELLSLVKWGYLYQGQPSVYHSRRRGTPTLDLPPATFVTYIENHDQLANSARGQRLCSLTSPGRFRAIAALLLLGPGTPMLFQGQEFSASAPFVYFADHRADLGRRIRQGRHSALTIFPSLADPAIRACLPDPADPATFERCKLDLSERVRHAETYALHLDLLRLRREDAVFSAQQTGGVDGAVLGAHAFVLRLFGRSSGDRLLLVNLGLDLWLRPTPEPLLAPPDGVAWEVLWSSEDPRYGGSGTPSVESEDGWRIPGESAVVLGPACQSQLRPVRTQPAGTSMGAGAT